MLKRVTNAIVTDAARPSCRIRIVEGASAGAEFDLPPVGAVIGAAAGSDIVLDDPAVSSKHARVVPKGAAFELTDVGSRNGTWVDGLSITQALVAAGTVFRLGSTALQLFPDEEVRELPPSSAASFGDIVGQSRAIRSVYALLERASASDAPVLLLGESGTGKELAARALHDRSPRSKKPFV